MATTPVLFPDSLQEYILATYNEANGATAQACSDLGTVFTYMSALTPNQDDINVTLGNGTTFYKGVYRAGGASTINGSLTFDADGDPDARFIVIIDGALSPNASTQIILADGAKSKNIYWAINGAVSVAGSVIFRGNIVANGAIIFSDNAALHGRALSTAGDITLKGNQMAIPSDDPDDPDNNVLVITRTPFNITENSFESGSTVSLVDPPNPAITEKGLIWSTTIDPTVSTYDYIDNGGGSGAGFYPVAVTGLTEGYRYYVRAYATDGTNYYYGLSRLVTYAFIPTLTEWAVIVFIGLLAGVGGLFIWRRS